MQKSVVTAILGQKEVSRKIFPLDSLLYFCHCILFEIFNIWSVKRNFLLKMEKCRFSLPFIFEKEIVEVLL